MATVPEANYAPFKQGDYLLCLGVIKYAPVLLFSFIGSHWISNNLRKNIIIFMILVVATITLSLSQIPTESFRYLSIFFVFALFSVIYEPVIEILASYWSEKKSNYLLINGLVTLARTSARYIGPLLISLFIGKHSNFQLPQLVTMLLIIFALALILCDFPENEAAARPPEQRISIRTSFRKICKSKLSIGLLLIYCIFYLGVSYLEYFVTILDANKSISLAQIFSRLGLGFVSSNLIILVTRGRLKQGFIFFLSLLLTGTCLIALPFTSANTTLSIVFLIGVGNGFAVPISLSIFQRLLGRELIGAFTGLLESSINLCALFSMGIAYLLFITVGSRYVFVFDGVMVISAAVVWLIIDKSEVSNE